MPRNPHPTRRSAAGSRQRRGSIYAVVLGMALLVSLIGLSAVAVGRVNLRVASIGSDAADAEMLALSAVEHAAAAINTDASWRGKYFHDVETIPMAVGRGAFTWKLVDEADGSLTAGGLQPVRVFGIGRVGEARRCYSVQLAPGGGNLFTNTGIEGGISGFETQGSDCVLVAATDEPRNGTKYLSVRTRLGSAAGPQQNLTGKIVSGNSYYVELWAKMTSAAEEPSICFVIKKAGVADTVFRVRGQLVKNTEWTRVSGTLTPSWATTPDSVYWRIETTATGQDFKIDDLKMVQSTSPTPMAPTPESWRQEALP